MLPQLPLLAALVLLQDQPQEAKGLQVLWVPQAGAVGSAAGFTFRHPLSGNQTVLPKAKGFAEILAKLPAAMKANGIWISTTNGFLYSEEENQELKALVALAKANRIYVFKCEIPDQPLGWRKIDD